MTAICSLVKYRPHLTLYWTYLTADRRSALIHQGPVDPQIQTLLKINDNPIVTLCYVKLKKRFWIEKNCLMVCEYCHHLRPDLP